MAVARNVFLGKLKQNKSHSFVAMHLRQITNTNHVQLKSKFHPSRLHRMCSKNGRLRSFRIKLRLYTQNQHKVSNKHATLSERRLV